jgi:hypothetical protein
MSRAASLPYPGDRIIDATMARAARRRLPEPRYRRLGGAVGSAGVSGEVCGAAGDVRPGPLPFPVSAAGGYASRYPGSAAAGFGAVGADAG